jgi:hypothetical protein
MGWVQILITVLTNLPGIFKAIGEIMKMINGLEGNNDRTKAKKALKVALADAKQSGTFKEVNHLHDKLKRQCRS